EIRSSLLALRRDGLIEIAGKHHPGVPGGDEVEAVGDRMVAAVVHDFLEATGSERGFGGDAFGQLADAGAQVVRRGENPVDQAELFGFGGLDIAPGVGQFAGDTLGDQAGQVLQGADVGDHGEVDFLDREHGIRRRVAHVAAGHEVERAADAGAVDGGEYRFAAAFDGGEAVLQVEDQPAQGFAAAGAVRVGDALLDAAQHGEVDAGAEVLAGAAEDGDPGFGGGVDPGEGLADFLPHRVVHRVRLVRPVEADFGDALVEAEGEGGEGRWGHGAPRKR